MYVLFAICSLNYLYGEYIFSYLLSHVYIYIYNGTNLFVHLIIHFNPVLIASAALELLLNDWLFCAGFYDCPLLTMVSTLMLLQ